MGVRVESHQTGFLLDLHCACFYGTYNMARNGYCIQYSCSLPQDRWSWHFLELRGYGRAKNLNIVDDSPLVYSFELLPAPHLLRERPSLPRYRGSCCGCEGRLLREPRPSSSSILCLSWYLKASIHYRIRLTCTTKTSYADRPQRLLSFLPLHPGVWLSTSCQAQ